MEVTVLRLEEMGTPVISIDSGPEYRINYKGESDNLLEKEIKSSAIDSVEEEYSKIEIIVDAAHFATFTSEIKVALESTVWEGDRIKAVLSITTHRLIEEFESDIL